MWPRVVLGCLGYDVPRQTQLHAITAGMMPRKRFLVALQNPGLQILAARLVPCIPHAVCTRRTRREDQVPRHRGDAHSRDSTTATDCKRGLCATVNPEFAQYVIQSQAREGLHNPRSLLHSLPLTTSPTSSLVHPTPHLVPTPHLQNSHHGDHHQRRQCCLRNSHQGHLGRAAEQ
jgi:ABC-type nickel/cobalt efflux system permease component RcnA